MGSLAEFVQAECLGVWESLRKIQQLAVFLVQIARPLTFEDFLSISCRQNATRQSGQVSLSQLSSKFNVCGAFDLPQLEKQLNRSAVNFACLASLSKNVSLLHGSIIPVSAAEFPPEALSNYRHFSKRLAAVTNRQAKVLLSQRRRLKKMIELPRKSRVMWSGSLWAFLSTMTVFDTSGNAIGYPVFFGFVLTYMRN